MNNQAQKEGGERKKERETIEGKVGPGNQNTEREKEREGRNPLPYTATPNAGCDIPCETQ